MPDKSFHLQRKDHNLEARGFLQSAQQFYDWEITTLFYAALHYVDAYFAGITNTLHQHPKSHMKRQKLVNLYLGQIAVEYGKLSKLSENARYESFQPQDSDVKTAEQWFQTVESFLGHLP